VAPNSSLNQRHSIAFSCEVERLHAIGVLMESGKQEPAFVPQSRDYGAVKPRIMRFRKWDGEIPTTGKKIGIAD
jgi:hypothetical protein